MLISITVVRVCKVKFPWSGNKQCRTSVIRESLLNVN